MQIIKAKSMHTNQIIACIEDARKYFYEAQIPQWQDPAYPSIVDIEQDIISQVGYVVMETEVIAYGAIIAESDPFYEKIEGKWLTDKPYFVIHRIAVKSEWKGKQVAKRLLDEAESLARKKGINSIRIDTHELNQSMRRFLEKNGFVRCGIVYVADHTPRIAYEKIIKV